MTAVVNFLGDLWLRSRPAGHLTKRALEKEVRFFSLCIDETWQLCSSMYAFFISGGVNSSTWDKLVKSKMVADRYLRLVKVIYFRYQ